MGFAINFRNGVGDCREKAEDLFQQPRWRLNIISLSLIGNWPFQKRSERIMLSALTFFFFGTLLTAQIRKVYFERDNMKVIIDSIAPFIFEGVASSKIFNNIINIGKMHKMVKHIEKDWEEIEGEERKILIKFANQGHMFNVVYCVWIYGAMVGFLILPITPRIIDDLGWANITDTARFQVPVDYYVDENENYFYIQLHIFIAVIFLCIIVVGTDIMFITLVQHACGMFSAISYTLESLGADEDANYDLYPERSADETFWIVVGCIKKQNSILQFAEILDSNFCWSFLVIVGLNMTIITFTGFQMTTKLDSVDEAIRQGIFTIGNLVHLFFESYISQRLTDHSLCIYEALKQTRFYNTSIRTRKLLNLMLLKSVIPCTMKAGKLYVMSMENFSMILRTSMSYFTILRSFQ
nr:olfactory receptor 21 [Gregopimpla kuwanae]